MLEYWLDGSYILLWGAHTQKRLYLLSEVVDSWRVDPQKIAVYLKRSSIFVVDEDADWEALDFLRLKHASKSLL